MSKTLKTYSHSNVKTRRRLILTKPNLFIIESLSYDDEKGNKFEGKIIADILHLSGKETLYYYVRTEQELRSVLEKFRESRFRYLHLSCHGNTSSISTTLNNISFTKFGDIIRPYLNMRRLFFSSCSVANYSLGNAIYSHSSCLSIIGPEKDLNFNDAAIAWSSFYHLMFKLNPNSMKNENIQVLLFILNSIYGTSLKFMNKTTFETERNEKIMKLFSLLKPETLEKLKLQAINMLENQINI